MHQLAEKVRIIRKIITVHTFHNSYVSHLLESGTDIPYTKVLLDHSSLKTTEIYTLAATKHRKSLGYIMEIKGTISSYSDVLCKQKNKITRPIKNNNFQRIDNLIL